ncbi:MAG: Npt1/Npt2 family nucleotide transporter [Candidatus Electryonea clarkiae]|nr:Npt1/Npt2 family nucleotide transporter [Candidatus Electryonea clarkiae]MDP8285783.1 Npt1/Npt2 family nucleotide transporter [Candidatus Electryonea clarkiae]
MANPFKAFLNIKRNELPLALLMFGYFFLVITSFWILKPLKKGLFIQYYDKSGFDLFSWHLGASQAELLAKVLNMFVAFLAVVVFTWLVRHFHRQQLTWIFTIFFMLSYSVYSMIIANPGQITVWSFYLFGDLFSTLMVATFFAFLNDSVAPDAAKRLYGIIGLGGVTGGVFGTTFLRIWIDQVSMPGWLWICFGIGILIVGISAAAGSIVEKRTVNLSDTSNKIKEKKSIDNKQGKGKNPAIEGAALVFRSPYLLSIVGIVGLYEVVSTLMDFQFTSTIVHFLDGPAIGKQFATVFTITNWTSMLVQFFLTSYIMTRFGLTTALMVLPIAALVGSMGYLAVPILWMGSLLNTTDNGFSYSINQSAKETLYVPTTKDEKYKAKAFIDMFVQRFAKALAVGISLLVTSIFTDYSAIRWLSLATVGIIILWVFTVRYAGRKFKEMTE